MDKMIEGYRRFLTRSGLRDKPYFRTWRSTGRTRTPW